MTTVAACGSDCGPCGAGGGQKVAPCSRALVSRWRGGAAVVRVTRQGERVRPVTGYSPGRTAMTDVLEAEFEMLPVYSCTNVVAVPLGAASVVAAPRAKRVAMPAVAPLSGQKNVPGGSMENRPWMLRLDGGTAVLERGNRMEGGGGAGQDRRRDGVQTGKQQEVLNKTKIKA